MSINERLAAIERSLRAMGGNSALPGIPEFALEHIPSSRLHCWEWELLSCNQLEQLLSYLPGIATTCYDPLPLTDGTFTFPQSVIDTDNCLRDIFTRFSNVLRAAHTFVARITPNADGQIAYADFGCAMEVLICLALDSLQFVEKQRVEMIRAHYEFSATPTIKPKVTPHVSAATSTQIRLKPLVSVADILGQIKERAELQRRAQALTSTGCGKKNKNRNRKKKRAGIGC